MHEPADTDPACVISVDCARGFTFLHWLNLRYGLHCFVFYGCIVVYPVIINFNNNLNIFMQDCCFSFKRKNCYQCRSCKKKKKKAPHKFVLTGKLIWFVHTSLGRQFFSGDRIANYSSPGTTEPTDRPSLCYKCRLCKRFCALTLVESSVRVVLFCFLRLHCGLFSTA